MSGYPRFAAVLRSSFSGVLNLIVGTYRVLHRAALTGARAVAAALQSAITFLKKFSSFVFSERSARVLGVLSAILALGAALYGGVKWAYPAIAPKSSEVLYQTKTAITVGEPSEQRTVASIDASNTADVAWSQDGQFVTWLTRPIETGTLMVGATVHVYDLNRNRQRDIQAAEFGSPLRDAQASLQVAFAQQYLYVMMAGDLYQIADLGFGDVQQRFVTLASPPGASQSGAGFDATQLHIGVGSKDFLYLYGPAAAASAYGGPSSVLQLPGRGAARLIATDETANLPISSLALSNDGTALAFVSGWRNGLCFNSVGGVTLVDLVSLSQQDIRLPEPASGYFLGVYGLFPYGDGPNFSVTTVRIGGDCVDDPAPLIEMYDVSAHGATRLEHQGPDVIGLLGSAEDSVQLRGQIRLDAGFFAPYPLGSDLAVHAGDELVNGVRRVFVRPN